jgi:hypothetical protein
MVVVAYAPTDVSNASIKDTFQSLLFGYLKVVPHVDKVVVLGDFNAELGYGWESSTSVAGQHHLHHGEAPFNNGECLLDLATSFGLRMAKTFFPHQFGHLGTWAFGSILPPNVGMSRTTLCAPVASCVGCETAGSLLVSSMAIATIGCWPPPYNCVYESLHG